MAEVKCVETAEINLLKEGNITAATCNCYDLCNEFEYTPTIHFLEYLYRLPLFDSFGSLASSFGAVFYGEESQIEVYYEKLKYRRVTEIPVYSTSDLSSNIGTS